MFANTLRLVPVLSLTFTTLAAATAGAGEVPPSQSPPAVAATACVSEMFPNQNLLPVDFCQRSAANRLRILQELADETEIAAPAAQKHIEVFAAKQKVTGSRAVAGPTAALPAGNTPDIKPDSQKALPVVAAAPFSLPVIHRVHNRAGELVAEAFLPGIGYRTLREGSPLPDDWRVYSITTDQVVITNNTDRPTRIPLPSSAPGQTHHSAPPTLDADLPPPSLPSQAPASQPNVVRP